MRLGLFGGSFNPIHYGHLGMARDAREKLQLDSVLFIPTGDPPHKQEGALAPANDRYEMVRLAITGEPSFDLSDVELRRTGKSYSIDTVRQLRQQYNPSTELYFLIGLDAFLDFPSWREPLALLQACRFVVISRPGQSFRSLASLSVLPEVDANALARLDTGTITSLDIALPSGSRILCLHFPPCPISASDIRQRIRRGETLAKLLPPSVESYILQHRLYQEDRNHTHI
jgi:nicotinate-nucleotide adenylyltransferase